MQGVRSQNGSGSLESFCYLHKLIVSYSIWLSCFCSCVSCQICRNTGKLLYLARIFDGLGIAGCPYGELIHVMRECGPL